MTRASRLLGREPARGADYWLIVLILFPPALIGSRLLRAPCDDAYIFYVYARNLLEGNGLTFNGALVEGYTSPLWTLLLALVGFTGVPLPIAGEVLSSAAGLFALVATHHLARSIGLRGFAALAPVVLLAASGDFLFYMASGMEVLLFTGLVAWWTGDVLAREDPNATRPWREGALVAAMILTRPEGALVALLFYGWLLLRSGDAIAVARGGARMLALLLPCLIVKALYYGYPLPNTYYAKSGAGLDNLMHGIGYVGQALPRLAPLLLMLVPAAVLRRERKALPNAPLAFLAVASAVWLAMVILTGGDNLVGGRALLAAMPWLCVLVTGVLAIDRSLVCLPSALAVAALMLAAYLTDARVRDHAAYWRSTSEIRTRVAFHLRDRFPKDTLVALNAAGIIPFHTRMPTIDMLGLNDSHIAHAGRRDRSLRFGHQAGDGEYVLARRPDVILLGFGAAKKPGAMISDREIASSPIFLQEYRQQTWPGIGFAHVRASNVDAPR